MDTEFLSEREEKTLALDVRRDVYFLVKKFAGSHFRELERASGLATGSVKYHLDYLTKCGLVVQKRSGNTVHYFPKTFDSDDADLMSLLRQRSIRRILLVLLSHGSCTHESIVSGVGLSASTVSWHVKKLVDASVVLSRKKGRYTYFKLGVDEERIIRLLISYKESFFDSVLDNIAEMWEA